MITVLNFQKIITNQSELFIPYKIFKTVDDILKQ